METPAPVALTFPHWWGLLWPCPLAGPSSGCGRPASHGLASGREEDKAQSCSSSEVIFKILIISKAETLTNQNGPKAPCCARCEFSHCWMMERAWNARREVIVSWGEGRETQNDRYLSNGRKIFLILISVQPYE